jgi:hypothetical protein
MRYEMIEVTKNVKKIKVKCIDNQEKAFLKVSLDPITLKCIDELIPESLQMFVVLKKDYIKECLHVQK